MFQLLVVPHLPLYIHNLSMMLSGCPAVRTQWTTPLLADQITVIGNEMTV